MEGSHINKNKFNTTEEELEHLLNILKIEQEEDRLQYQQTLLQNSLAERKNLGVTWYPIVIKESYYGIGERLILEIERPTGTDIQHQFQTGKVASLFSNYHNEGSDNPSIAGVINSVGLNRLKLTLFVDELPDWASSGKLGLDLLFDENSYKEMEFTINRVIKSKNNRLAELREILLGKEEALFTQLKERKEIENLNSSQNTALHNVLAAKDLAIIHGPPGTGKTTTLVEAIARTLENEKQVLVTAASNTAVDLLTEKLDAKGLRVLRIGNPARVNEAQLSHTIDAKISAHKEFKRIKEFRKQSAEYRNLAHKYKRSFGREERDQRKLLFDEARKLQQEAIKIENYIVEDLLEKAQVITATLLGSANQYIRDRQYGTIFIDEAAQALEPLSWIPIARAGRVILAGDHCQLPPTVKSLKAAKEGLSRTLFEKSIERQKADVMLETQYRMHEDIMNFSNKEFYKGLLKADDSVKNRTLSVSPDSEILNKAIEFIDTAGCGFEEQQKESISLSNPEESNLLFKHLNLLIDNLQSENIKIADLKVGIISPYKAQVNLLKEKLSEQPWYRENSSNISINTVDGFQGQERDIIYISLVRSNTKSEIGFLSDVRRMNVALTRAKKKLIVIGDSATLSSHPFYKDFLAYIDSVNAYKSAWEFIQ